jgi:RNA polymerase sigma factor (TIGR02999 family)
MEAEHRITGQLVALRNSGGEPTAWHDLMPLVYDELRAIARRQLHRERDCHTLDATALVHETYLRLVNQQHAHWHDRAQFFAIASRIMRRVLIDYARQHRAGKRWGADEKVSLEGAEESACAAADERAELLVALDEALTRLGAADERLVQVVECRFFGGMSEEETAAALGVTARTVRRDWVKARGWLRRSLEP